MLFSKPSKSIGIDIGAHSVKTVQMSRRGNRLTVEAAGYAPVDPTQLNADPVLAQADAVVEALERMPGNQALYVGALPGQTVVIRYPRFDDMPDSELARAIEDEAGQNIPYDLSDVYLDWSVLDKESTGDRDALKVLLVAAKHDVIDSRVQVAQASELQFSVLSVDNLALADAAECCDFLRVGETVAIVNLGATSTSIHFIKDGVSNFIRDVQWGAKELVQAIAKATRCDYAEAESMLIRMATQADAPAAPEAPEAEAPPPPPPDSGGGSLLDPLEDELGGLDEGLGSAAPAAAPAATADPLSNPREMLATPIARLVGELRRSFDYYEQQLYERPVDRILLSGGAAQLGALGEALREELGLEQVEVANPMDSALRVNSGRNVMALAEHPAQFMVAIGLAARGAAEL